MIYLFLITRILDIYTTLLGINKWGTDIEGNPVTKFMLENGLFFVWQFLWTAFALWFGNITIHKKLFFGMLSGASLLVAISNAYCYIFIN